LRLLEENSAFVLGTRLWAGRYQGFNTGKDERILRLPKRPDWLFGPDSLLGSNFLLHRG